MVETPRKNKAAKILIVLLALTTGVLAAGMLAAGCSGCGRDSGLVGNWWSPKGAGPFPTFLSLHRNGKAVMDARECTWKIEEKRLVLVLSDSPAESRKLMFEYRVQDSQLVLANPWNIRTDKRAGMNHGDFGGGAVVYSKAR